jgi:TatD DNase family protein
MLLDSHTHNFNSLNAIVNFRDNASDIYKGNFSYGFHPWEEIITEKDWDEFKVFLDLNKCVALGEVGLDKIKGPTLDIQIERLKKQLEINKSFSLPVIVHCVKSWNEIKMLSRQYPDYKWIFHGFNKVGILEEVLKEGWMISVGVSILTNLKLQQAINKIPTNQLLLETDDSDIDIFTIYQKISEIKKISLPELEEIITNNFKSTFKKWLIG